LFAAGNHRGITTGGVVITAADRLIFILGDVSPTAADGVVVERSRVAVPSGDGRDEAAGDIPAAAANEAVISGSRVPSPAAACCRLGPGDCRRRGGCPPPATVADRPDAMLSTPPPTVL
jgi:hypothetical protein